MSNKDDLLRTIAEAQAKLQEIQAQEDAEKNARLIGRCFKYRNSYPSPSEPGDYWWLYVRVMETSERGLFLYRFQRDKYGRIEIEPADRSFAMLSLGYEEITLNEYLEAWQSIFADIQRMDEKIKSLASTSMQYVVNPDNE